MSSARWLRPRSKPTADRLSGEQYLLSAPFPKKRGQRQKPISPRGVGGPALQVLEPAQCRQCSAEPSSNKHFLPNEMKPDNTRGFSCSSISEMAVNRVFNHRTKLFNAFCLCHDRMPETSGYESPIHLVFTYFKKDLFHFNGMYDLGYTLA